MGTYHYHYKLIATPANPSIHIANYAKYFNKIKQPSYISPLSRLLNTICILFASTGVFIKYNFYFQ